MEKSKIRITHIFKNGDKKDTLKGHTIPLVITEELKKDIIESKKEKKHLV